MKDLVILLLLPLLLGDPTPELVSDYPETAPTCYYDSDCLDYEDYNCCIGGICYYKYDSCDDKGDCDSNCCILGKCKPTSDCKSCSENSECEKTKCCKDDSCVPSENICCDKKYDCISNCCLNEYCEPTKQCGPCKNDSDCLRSGCCKNGDCMRWYECDNTQFWIIVGIAVGAVVLIVVGGIIGWCKKRWYNNW